MNTLRARHRAAYAEPRHHELANRRPLAAPHYFVSAQSYRVSQFLLINFRFLLALIVAPLVLVLMIEKVWVGIIDNERSRRPEAVFIVTPDSMAASSQGRRKIFGVCSAFFGRQHCPATLHRHDRWIR